MMPQTLTPYYADESVTLYLGDALAVLREMPDASVDCCVTSPPYFGLRDYGTDGQYGLEASPAEYVETMRALFAQVRRVLADDGTLWLNIGDSYSAGRDVHGVLAKNLLGIPWRLAFALQSNGWILRNDVIWAKPNGMPESVTDRLASKHEHVFVLSKSTRYWFDLDPIRESHSPATVARLASGPVKLERRTPGEVRDANVYGAAAGTNMTATGERHLAGSEQGKNPGDVWTVATQPFTEAHFATMPQELARRAIVAGCKPGGIVLDPFSGSGTTGMVAGRTGRRYVGIDLNPDYLDLSLRTRLAQSALLDGEAPA